MIKFYKVAFIFISVVFPLEVSFTLSYCSADIGFLTSSSGHPPNLKSSSSISHLTGRTSSDLSLSLLTFGPFFFFFFFPTLTPPLSRGHFESSPLPFSLFSLLSPLNENPAHFTHFELPTGASPYSVLLHCYTQILQNLIFLNFCLPADCEGFTQILLFSFFILFFIIFIYSLTTSRPIAPILYECGAIVTTLSYYII